MPDEFESGFFGGNIPAWHRLGNVIPEDVVTAAEAIEVSGLGWEVSEAPVFAEVALPSQFSDNFTPAPARVELPEHKAIVRATDRRPLGVVGKGYTPIQNRDAFDFMDTLVDSGEAKFHTAGSLRGGRVIWMLSRIPGDILIGGEESERVARFLLLRNSHDGTTGLGLFETPVRVVCMNTLNAAIAKAIRSWTTRHTSGIEGRIQQARTTMELSFRFYAEFERIGNELLDQQMSVRGLDIFVEDLIPYPPELAKRIATDEGGRAAKNIDEAREAIRTIALQEPNLDNVRGTAWAAYNAVAQWQDHGRPVRVKDERKADERKFIRAVEENEIKSRALRLLAPTSAHTAGDNLKVLAEV